MTKEEFESLEIGEEVIVGDADCTCTGCNKYKGYIGKVATTYGNKVIINLISASGGKDIKRQYQNVEKTLIIGELPF